MFFWNRVEIYCGFSLKDFSELRDALASAGIRYDYRLITLNSSGTFSSNRARFATLGQNPKYETQYYLYVHHKNYDQAMYLTSNRNS